MNQLWSIRTPSMQLFKLRSSHVVSRQNEGESDLFTFLESQMFMNVGSLHPSKRDETRNYLNSGVGMWYHAKIKANLDYSLGSQLLEKGREKGPCEEEKDFQPLPSYLDCSLSRWGSGRGGPGKRFVISSWGLAQR